MSRANRYLTRGRVYHVTHRCHDRQFLLRFRRDRDAYRALLRRELRERQVWLIGYALTSNHVHLLVVTEDREELAHLMQCVAGEFARSYNRRKGRSGAYWGDRYHATLIENGRHLSNCLVYIDLNMVRAGAVAHPNEWEWCGFHELTGSRQRYRLIDDDRLFAALGPVTDPSTFADHYRGVIDSTLDRKKLRREPVWTESLAVGSQEFVESVLPMIHHRPHVQATESDDVRDTWVLREEPAE